MLASLCNCDVMQHNARCSQLESDVAGTHTLDGFGRDARKLIQGGPFWERAYPDFLLWKASVFQEFKCSGLWDRWSNLQIGFCASMERGASALKHPAYGMVGFSSGVVVVNHWFEHKVRCPGHLLLSLVMCLLS